jgi:hypothetical protein
MGTLACAVGELWALVNLLRPLEGRDFSSRVAAQITASILTVLALPLGLHDALWAQQQPWCTMHR